MRHRLVLATHNEHKRREFDRLLPDCEISLLPADIVLPPEDGETFGENALNKARACAHQTGQITVADDSGIEAAVLGGAPGIRSARFASEHATDEENLLRLIEEVPPGSALRYVCALAYVDPRAKMERSFEGRCEGTMASARAGDRGFGYDPIFVPDVAPSGPGDVDVVPSAYRSVTMAELSDRDKDSISHRAIATRALWTWLRRG